MKETQDFHFHVMYQSRAAHWIHWEVHREPENDAFNKELPTFLNRFMFRSLFRMRLVVVSSQHATFDICSLEQTDAASILLGKHPKSSKIKSWHVAFPHSHTHHTLHDFSHLWRVSWSFFRTKLTQQRVKASSLQLEVSATVHGSQCENHKPQVFRKSSYRNHLRSRMVFFFSKSLVYNHMFTTEKSWNTRNPFNRKDAGMSAQIFRSWHPSKIDTGERKR